MADRNKELGMWTYLQLGNRRASQRERDVFASPPRRACAAPLARIAAVLLLWTSAHGQESISLKGHGGWIGAVAFSPDSGHLAVGASDGSVTTWDLKDREKLDGNFTNVAVSSLFYSKDGKMLGYGGHDGWLVVKVFSPRPETSLEVHMIQRHKGAILTLTSDGKRLFSGGIDGTIRQWDIDLKAEPTVFSTHDSWVNGLAINPSGELLASGSSDNTLQVRRLNDKKLVTTLRVNEGEIRSVAFSPDGKHIAGGIRYGHVRVWNIETKKEVASLKAHAGETWAVAFTPDGKTLASGGGDWNKPGEVRLWDTDSWKERTTLKHTGEVLCLTISPNGRYLAAGSWDRTVRVWRLQDR